ncbi:MAG: protein kinase [bacterium]
MTDLRDQLQSSLGGAYTIERELGGGGMSRVFVAEETALGRRVVIKVLPQELAGGVSIARFRREMSLAARLQHPHIVALIASGEVDGLPYYTMPFVEGESLRGRLAHGELPIALVISILRDVAKALDYAHARHVAHRDIKPDNVLLAGSSAVVTDFGVAKALSESTAVGPLTSIGIALGTPAYMAPEQAAADPTTDLRADIYSFGAMAYEMLAGHPPFAGRNTQAVLAAHAVEAPAPIGMLRAATPPPLADLVMRCLEKRPGDRPQRASELLQVLDAVGTPSGVVPGNARGASAGIRARRVIAIVVAAVCVIAAGAWYRSRPRGALAPELRSIAVLPFENRSGDTTFDYLEDGVTDHVRDALNTVTGLSVKARGSSIQMKGINAREVGGKLGVEVVVQGSLSRSGSRLHLTTELVRTSDERALWSRTFDGRADELGGMQDTIVRAVSMALHLPAPGERPSRDGGRGTTDAEAYDLFLRGRHAKDRFDDAHAIALLSAAVKRDPHFARAVAFLAMAYADSPMMGAVSADAAMRLARENADKALALDSSVVEGYIADSYVMATDYRRLGDAVRPLERAFAIDSNNVDLLWSYAFALAQIGRVQEGLVQARRARAKDPLRVIGLLGKLLGMVHQYDDAIAETRSTLALDPGHVFAYRELGFLYAFTGQRDSALAQFETAYRIDPRNFGSGANLVFGYAQAGRWKDAERMRASIEGQGGGGSPNYAHALADLSFGQYDAAMTALEAAVDHGDPLLASLSLPCELMFDPLKANARFDVLMRRIGAHACPASGRWPIHAPPGRAASAGRISAIPAARSY